MAVEMHGAFVFQHFHKRLQRQIDIRPRHVLTFRPGLLVALPLPLIIASFRELLALHFDAEASLESRVNRDSYEVHIRMPYRTTKAAAQGSRAPHAAQREPGIDRDIAKRREPHLAERAHPIAQLRAHHG